MKNKYKFLFYYILYIACFIAISSCDNNSTKSKSKTMLTRHGGHRGHHGRHHRHRGRTDIQFRFDFGPSRRYYRDDSYYYRSVPLYCEVQNDTNAKVVELSIGSSVIPLMGNEGYYSFSLRPGYYTIRWRVKSKTLFGDDYKNYTRTISVSRNLQQIMVRIKGNYISVDYIRY